jgi:hypothetical protein
VETLNDDVAAYQAEVLAAESVASENSVAASGDWVAALEMDDAIPASMGESSVVF